jgi:hypothetical protein
MPRTEVIALASVVRASLDRGDLAGLGPIDFGGDGVLDDAEIAARIALADVDHCARKTRTSASRVSDQHWDGLAEQLRILQRAVERRLAEEPGRLPSRVEASGTTLSARRRAGRRRRAWRRDARRP